MEKEYVRIQWENRPSIATPLGRTNLNKMDYQIDKNENTLITFDTTKANQSDLLQTIRTLTYDTETGIFVFTFWNGSTYSVDLNIEKIPVTFSMDEYGVITMTTADGTTYTCDIGALIKLYTFVDGDEIDFVTTTDAGGNKTITASIKDGSIVGSKLQPNFLADCQAAKAQAELAATSASSDASDAELSSEDSEAWAVGERNGQPVPSTDPAYENNAKWWAQHGTGSSFAGLSDTNFTNLQNGQIAKYNITTQKWENTEDEGGLLPHFKITSEAGSTVTVVCPDTSVIVPTQTSSGIWQCDVPTYGVYTVHAVINGDDAVRTVTVDTVKEYVIHDEHYSYTLNVYAPTGSSIIVTDGDDETYTGTGAGSTAVIFALHQASTTYTITVTYDGLDSSTTITSSATTGGSGSKTIEFGTINLTLDEDLIGETVVMTNGTATKSKVADSTSMVFYPNTTGNWTISCQYEGETYYSEPNPVVVSSLSTAVSAEISLVHIPEGATVLPTDDIQIWLKCANIQDKSYTTLAEVLADRETFETLIADSNACDYMARSTTWAKVEGLVPIMTGATTPSGEASASNTYSSGYPWKAFNGTNVGDYDGWIANFTSTYIPAWICYKFDNAVCVNRVYFENRNYSGDDNVRIKTYKVQASNDDFVSDIHDLTDLITRDNSKNVPKGSDSITFNNNNAYTSYRLYITERFAGQGSHVGCAILQFYEADITTSQYAMSLIGKYDYCSNALLSNATWADALLKSDYRDEIFNIQVPKMTSNTTPSGTVIAGSAYSTAYDAFKAFDKDNSTRWNSNASAQNEYIGYTFTEPVVITGIKIRNYQVYTCKIQASNDGTNWTDLTDTLDITPYVQGDDYYFTINNNTKYRHYCVRCLTSQQGTTNFSIYEIQFYGRASSEVLIPLVPTMTSDTTPSGTVIYSSQYTDQKGFYAFDGITSDSWSTNGTEFPCYIGYHFNTAKVVSRCSVLQRINGTFNGVTETAKVQASNDGETWTDLTDSQTFVIMVASNASWINIDFSNSTAYTYYRLHITAVSNANVWGTCAELQFYEKAAQTNIIHSAPNDTIYMLEDGVPTPICRTNEDGDGIFDFSELEEGVYTFGSTVAKNPSDLTEDFKKRFRITKTPYGGTTERYLLPDTIDTLYWYGYEDDTEIISSANGWSVGYSGMSFQDPTFQTNYVDCSTASAKLALFGSKTKKKVGSKAHSIALGVTVVNGTYGTMRCDTDKTIDGTGLEQAFFDSNTLKKYDVTSIADSYIDAGSSAGRSVKIYGLWYDRISSDIPTFISAANDTLYIMDGNTKVYVANTDGSGKSYEPMLEAGTYTIYSSVAKDPNNLSSPYSKTVTVDESTQTIAVMPDAVKTLYWWGYMSDNLEDMNTANGWSYSGTTFGVPSKNTNSMRFSTSNGVSVGVGSKNKVSASKVNVVTQGVTVAYNNYGFVTAYQSKSNWSGETSIANASLSKTEITSSGDKYIFTHSASGRAMDLYAFWYE